MAHSVILQDTENEGKKRNKLTSGHIVGSNNLWNFSESLQVDKKINLNDMDEATTADEKAPFLLTIEERVQAKLKERGITVPAELLSLKKSGDDDGEQEQEVPKEDARIHYDKEDLISFHQLFISKPLTKAALELDYEHPTVIQRKVIPAILEGNDVLAHSVTGSGKTAAYLLPIMEKFIKMRNAKAASIGKLRFLVLQPTRELAA